MEFILQDRTTQCSPRERTRFKLDMLLKNRLGTSASDFSFVTSEQKQADLYTIQSPLLLLCFYNPDGTACKETTTYLRQSSIIDPLIKKGQLTVLAVYTDQDTKTWRTHLSDIQANWIKAYDEGMYITKKRLYNLRAIPCLCMLDKDKWVLLKDLDIRRLEVFLQGK